MRLGDSSRDRGLERLLPLLLVVILLSLGLLSDSFDCLRLFWPLVSQGVVLGLEGQVLGLESLVVINSTASQKASQVYILYCMVVISTSFLILIMEALRIGDTLTK